MSSSILVRVTCDAVCVSVRIDADSGEPVLTMDDPDDCSGGLLPGPIDLVRSDLGSLTGAVDHVDLGGVEPVGCDEVEEKYGFCSGRLESGRVELFLARNAGEANYGFSSTGLPRVAASGTIPRRRYVGADGLEPPTSCSQNPASVSANGVTLGGYGTCGNARDA
jgi:hypothetical protein